MAFDDGYDNKPISVQSAAAAVAAAQAASDEGPTAEDALEEEAQDFRHFSSMFAGTNKKGFSSQTIRKGEKDFEAHGTRAQDNALEQSRQAMEQVLSYTRVHKGSGWCRGWFFPDVWSDRQEDEAEVGAGVGCGSHADGKGGPEKSEPPKREAHSRDRVVAVETENGKMFATAGRHIPNAKKTQPGWDRLWLLPEEALFLVERGSLDLWWPTRPIGDVFPTRDHPGDEKAEEGEKCIEEKSVPVGLRPDPDGYDLGLPLSLQAAYALLIGAEGERGKVTLQKYQVYANLRRHGYILLRAPQVSPAPAPVPVALQLVKPQVTLWQWLFSLLSLLETKAKPWRPNGPLVRPGLYRSYKQVFEQLDLITRYKPYTSRSAAARSSPDDTRPTPKDPFRVVFHVWKSGAGSFSKTRPAAAPDFRIAVVDAHATSVPSVDEIVPLLESGPWDPPRPQWTGPGRLYPRLKHGFRNVVVAIVDHGVVNYIRFGEAAFGEEPIWGRFDANVAPRDGKVGRGERGRGRGGAARGGRGGGRVARGRGRV